MTTVTQTVSEARENLPLIPLSFLHLSPRCARNCAPCLVSFPLSSLSPLILSLYSPFPLFLFRKGFCIPFSPSLHYHYSSLSCSSSRIPHTASIRFLSSVPLLESVFTCHRPLTPPSPLPSLLSLLPPANRPVPFPPLTNSPPCVVVSAVDELQLVYQCLNMGASDFLTKPIRQETVENLWRAIWRKRKDADLQKRYEDLAGTLLSVRIVWSCVSDRPV